MFYVLLKDELPVYEKVWNKADAFCPLNNRALSKRFFFRIYLFISRFITRTPISRRFVIVASIDTDTYYTSIGNCSVDWLIKC